MSRQCVHLDLTQACQKTPSILPGVQAKSLEVAAMTNSEIQQPHVPWLQFEGTTSDAGIRPRREPTYTVVVYKSHELIRKFSN